NNVYEEELENFIENGDEGEIWCVFTWSSKLINTPLHALIEVGSGNGAPLFALAEGPYPHLGVDCSEGTVQLAQSGAHARNLTAVTLRVCDFLHEDPPLLADDQKANQNGVWGLII
ncbi:hypothetical protein F4604DRAFT_1549226, partial [Suillus subluteus]